MKIVRLPVEPREKLGSAHARRLRRTGRLPVNLYGLDRPPACFSVDRHQFGILFERGSRMFELAVGDKTQVCLLKDVQYNSLGDVLQHADFWRVDDQKSVAVNVAVEFIGQPDPVSGAVVDYVARDIQITCLPRNIPSHVEVDIGALQVGEHVEAKDIQLPEGATHNDPHRTLVTYHYKHAPAEGAAATEATEPEVLTERRPPAGEE